MENLKFDFKFILNIVSLVAAIIYGWHEMQSRITALELKIEEYDKMSQLRLEIQTLKNYE
tara:strand:- start:1797 stop:1976 length:180 start_codon:yes stop_codon:yes gene_type:complete